MRDAVTIAVTAALVLLGAYLATAQAPAAKGPPPGATAAAPGARPALLADRHVATGLTCASCHGAARPAEVALDTCLSCHGSYADVARRTAGLARNPHDSHYPGLECTTCHHGHQPFEDFCASCHGPR
jgi:fumarate reductase flavoprotein subunit